MFGGNPLPFYAYNVVASALTILAGEPRDGVFELARRHRRRRGTDRRC